jgi:RimJ/RimL family protein N-acetyltransferase
MSPHLRTPRLDLVAATRAMLQAELDGERERLARFVGATVPREWPPDLYDDEAVRFTLDWLDNHPGQETWGFHYFVLRADPDEPEAVLIGAGGYKGPPDDHGDVELGYSIMGRFRRRGFASEAVRAFVTHAFHDARVLRVTAETLPHLIPSIGVLQKCGFSFAGPGSGDGVIRYVLARDQPQ